MKRKTRRTSRSPRRVALTIKSERIGSKTWYAIYKKDRKISGNIPTLPRARKTAYAILDGDRSALWTHKKSPRRTRTPSTKTTVRKYARLGGIWVKEKGAPLAKKGYGYARERAATGYGKVRSWWQRRQAKKKTGLEVYD